jgi:hypothetical protein
VGTDELEQVVMSGINVEEMKVAEKSLRGDVRRRK